MPERQPKASPSRGAERARASRARRKRGEACHTVNVGAAVYDALVKSGRLSDSAVTRRRLVNDALSAVLGEWGDKWKG